VDERVGNLIEYIRTSVIGDDRAIDGPFGVRRVTYADYTASGRSLHFIEDFVRDEVMPLYANTHTETSTTGLQTTKFREDARRIILESVNGTDEDVVIFCGSGATGAINKLIEILNLRLPADLDDLYGFSGQIPDHDRPIVFIGPYEHHSNEILWRETIADVVVIDEDQDGRIDERHLERELLAHSERSLKIGSFSAASNVTGIVSNTYSLAALLHRHGALSFWDFAAAAPYVEIDMNPGGDEGEGLSSKDAVFISSGGRVRRACWW
jgi:selenocysteine lyase/cysteine desulfurase